MKKLRLLALLLSFSTLARAQSDPLSPANFPPVDQNAADYPANVWVTGPLAKVRQDSGSPVPNPIAIVYATQNEFQGFQIHINANAGNISNYSVTMSDLVNAQTGTHISAASSDIVVYRMAYINVTLKTATGASYYNSTGRYPDILIPAADLYYQQKTNAFPFTITSGNNQSVWVDVHIPPGAPSGYYSGTATLKTGSTVIAALPVVYAVWQWPSAGHMPSTSSLHYVAGFGYGSLCQQVYGASNNCGSYPGAGGSSDLGVTLINIDATLLALDHRLSGSGSTNIYPGSGSFSSFETYYGPLLNGTATPNNTTTILPGAQLNTFGVNCPGGCNQPGEGPTFQNWQTNWAANGWSSSTLLFWYLCDEPPNGCSWSTLVSNGAQEHGFSTPPVANLVTTNMTKASANGAQNVIDSMATLINDMDPQGGSLQRPAYNTWLAGSSGVARSLFSYQSCESATTCSNGTVGNANATWPNYDIDGFPAANRVFEWLTFLHNESGELYYALDYCFLAPCGYPSPTQDPWISSYNYGENGAGNLVYPGGANRALGNYVGVTIPIWLPSLRLKMLRDGMQDYEYLNALTRAGKGAFVTAQITSWITNSYTFDETGTGLTKARQSLGMALHQLTYSSTPMQPPQPPQLANSAPLPLNGTLNFVSQPQAGNVTLTVSLTPQNSGSIKVSGAGATGSGVTPSYSTSGPGWSLSLSHLGGIAPGLYVLVATAQNAAGESSPLVTQVVLVSAAVINPRVYPNPWREDKHSGHPITFDQMAGGGTIKVFTVSGHLVKSLPVSSGGSATWDLTNDSGATVASGIYLYVITDGQGNKSKGQLHVIK